MHLIVKLSQPKSDKERLFRLEIPVEDLRTPGEAYVTLDGKEYLIEVHY